VNRPCLKNNERIEEFRANCCILTHQDYGIFTEHLNIIEPLVAAQFLTGVHETMAGLRGLVCSALLLASASAVLGNLLLIYDLPLSFHPPPQLTEFKPGYVSDSLVRKSIAHPCKNPRYYPYEYSCFFYVSLQLSIQVWISTLLSKQGYP